MTKGCTKTGRRPCSNLTMQAHIPTLSVHPLAPWTPKPVTAVTAVTAALLLLLLVTAVTGKRVTATQLRHLPFMKPPKVHECAPHS